nr:MAG TPA: programmed cell death activator [Caudoviricetes sp.]
MKEFLKIMCDDMDREGFTAKDYLVYGLLGPMGLFAVLAIAEALA